MRYPGGIVEDLFSESFENSQLAASIFRKIVYDGLRLRILLCGIGRSLLSCL
ncbi:MAG: hypothetical protein V7K60_24660 [Nostoc sp.]